MSFILSQWLNAELQLSQNVPSIDIDSALKSGYLLGEILHKLDLQDDFPSLFSKASTLEAYIRNYTLIERTLFDKLGIRISSNDAFDLIHGKSGCATKLLYQIKSSHARLPPVDPIEKRVTNAFRKDTLKPNDPRLVSYPTSPTGNPSPIVISNNQNKKANYIEKEHAFFAELLKSKLHRYDKAHPTFEKDWQVPIPPLKQQANTSIKLKSDHVFQKSINDDVQQRLKEQKERDEGAKKLMEIHQQKMLQKIQKKQKVVLEKRKKIAFNFLEQVEVFEAKLDPSKVNDSLETTSTRDSKDSKDSKDSNRQELESAPSEPINAQDIKEYLKRSKLDPVSHLKAMPKKLLPEDLLQKQSKDYLSRIHSQKVEQEASKRDRELRRRKLLLNQQMNQEEFEKSQLQDLMLKKLARQSKQERRIAEQLMQVRHEKSVMRENRMFRDLQYNQRRQQDYEEAIEREYQYFELARIEYQKQTELQLNQHLEILERKKQEKHAKNTLIVEKLVGELVDLSLKISEYRSLNEYQEAPKKLLREWKTLFFHEQPLYKMYEISQEKEVIAPKKELELVDGSVAKGVNLLDEQEFDDYLNSKNEWTYPSVTVNETSTVPLPPKNEQLGQIVDDILKITGNPIEPYKALDLGQTLKLAVLGKPYSQKNEIAQELANAYGITVLNIETILQECVKSADVSNLPKTGFWVSKEQISGSIKLAMTEGKKPDDKLMHALVLDAIKTSSAQNPKGWILVDYPRNKGQLHLLEKELSGYEEPEPLPLGELKRQDKSPMKSLIAVKEDSTESQFSQSKSGLDGVILLNVSNQVSLERALGERFNLLSNQPIHLQDQQDISQDISQQKNIVSLPDDSESKRQLQYQLDYFESQEEEIKSTLMKFDILYELDASKKQDWLTQESRVIVQELLKSKSSQVEESNLADPTLSDPKSGQSAQPITNTNATTTNTRMQRNVEFEKRKMTTKELANILSDEWKTIESSYTYRIKFLFRSLRKEQELALHYFYNTKSVFKTFLSRPDKKQDLVDLFLREYNAIEEDFRSDPDVKAELHHRADDLREKLWELTDSRKEEADEERVSIIDDRWVEDHSIIIENIYIAFLQAELDRFIGTKQFIIDYFKDAYGAVLPEATLSPVKLPSVPNTQPSPIDISSLLITFYKENQGKKEQPPSKPMTKVLNVPSIQPNAANPKDKKANAAQQSAAASAIATKPIYDLSARFIPSSKDYPKLLLDLETMVFPDFQAAYDLAINCSLVELPEDKPVVEQKDKKDKKKTSSPETETRTQEVNLPSEFQKCIDIETERFKLNLLRMKTKLSHHLLQLMTDGFQSFIKLDEWTIQRFTSEMESIRQLLLVVREAIEAEAKLPNYLKLTGDEFQVDFGTITFPLQAEVRPESPVEKTNFYEFTTLQLLNLARQFREIAPKGMIMTKDFIENMSRYIQLSLGTQLIPEMLIQSTNGTLQQICTLLDPFETGFVSWRRYLLIQSRILPVPSLDYLISLKAAIQSCPSYSNGKINLNDYNSLPLWFKDMEGNHDVVSGYNRTEKLLSTIFYVFSDLLSEEAGNKGEPSMGVSLIEEHQKVDFSNDLFDADSFLLYSCLDEIPNLGLQKAFHVVGKSSDGNCNLDELYKILHFTLPIVPESNRTVQDLQAVDPYPIDLLKQIILSTGKDVISFDELCDKTKVDAPFIFSCPLYLLDDVTLFRSRPSTSST